MAGVSPGASSHLAASVQRVLRIGILAAALLLAIGLALLIARGLPPLAAAPSHVSLEGLPGGLASGQGRAFVLLGVMVLLLTPLARVVLSVATFAREGDRDFTIITVFVLAILITSLALGVAP